MKKIICALAAAAFAIALPSCGKKDTEVSFGAGAHAYYSAVKNASEESEGYGKISVTVAAVKIDKNGRILECELDACEIKSEFTYDGKFVPGDSFSTKGELGSSYGMKGASSVGKEWYEQADAFEDAAEGKTLDQIKERLATGESEIISAGCTVDTSDFIAAIESAVSSAKPISASPDTDVELGIVTVRGDCKNASEEADGALKTETVFTAVLKGADDRAAAVFTDSAEASVTFDASGKCTLTSGKEIKTKKTMADSYGMSKYGTDKNGDGRVLEWYLQAAEFERGCIGKTAEETALLSGKDGYASADLQNAGCTISVSALVRSAVKALD